MFIAIVSAPVIPISVILFIVLFPAPPAPTTFIFAFWADNNLSNSSSMAEVFCISFLKLKLVIALLATLLTIDSMS